MKHLLHLSLLTLALTLASCHKQPAYFESVLAASVIKPFYTGKIKAYKEGKFHGLSRTWHGTMILDSGELLHFWVDPIEQPELHHAVKYSRPLGIQLSMYWSAHTGEAKGLR